jgi:hypothetical protein
MKLLKKTKLLGDSNAEIAEGSAEKTEKKARRKEQD